MQPVGPIEFDHTNPRPATPEDVGGEVQVAAFNVLNYFNGDGAGGGFPTARGAETPFEFERQRDKIIAAIGELDADVVGLMELENDDTDARVRRHRGPGGRAQRRPTVRGPTTSSTPASSAPTRSGWASSTSRHRVTPVGDFAVLDSTVDPRFIATLNRPSIAQTFEANADGARFTAVVNHLKSKGSDCDAVGDPDTGDGQGNCNGTRTAAAEALVDWLDTDPTGSGDTDFLLLGDMNAYAQEDPITAFRDAGYVDTIDDFVGDEGYSYVFEGQSGYLDHALASPSLAVQVNDVTEWHINADEPIALDYNVNFKSAGQVESFYSDEAYRSSDHDPVLVGLDLNAYDFTGFLAPIANLPAYNGDQGRQRGADQVQPATATRGSRSSSTGTPTATPIRLHDGRGHRAGPRRSTSSEALSYRSDIDTYSLTWKTAKGWTGCRLLTVELDDGTVHEARFRFGK